MQSLRNWDNKTWLSSKKYISKFHQFLTTKVILKKNTKILDIGCGRANIISFLQNKYKFRDKAIGIDIVKNNDVKKNILFKKIDAIKFLRKSKKFDLILIKQTIHFFSEKKLKVLLNLVKKKLKPNGKILIFSLKTRNNQIPCFKLMKQRLDKSLKKDEVLIQIVKKKLVKTKDFIFKFKVIISKKKYLKMIQDRYISCLLNLSRKELKKGISEIKLNYKNKIKFTDTLRCIIFRK